MQGVVGSAWSDGVVPRGVELVPLDVEVAISSSLALMPFT